MRINTGLHKVYTSQGLHAEKKVTYKKKDREIFSYKSLFLHLLPGAFLIK